MSMPHLKLKKHPKDHHVTTKLYRCLPIHSPSRSTNRTFHQFPQLPTELRLKIWRLALLDPNRVDLKVVPYTAKSWEPVTSFKIIRQSMNPYLTSLCVESRAEALLHYKLCFDDTSFINFGTDRGVCLRNRSAAGFNFFMGRLSPYELAAIENLILRLSVWRDSSDTGFSSQIRKLAGLRMLQFLVDENDEEYAFSVTKDVIRQEMMNARGEADAAWKAPRVHIINPYGLEKGPRVRTRHTSDH